MTNLESPETRFDTSSLFNTELLSVVVRSKYPHKGMQNIVDVLQAQGAFGAFR